jgi:hypothetical protein
MIPAELNAVVRMNERRLIPFATFLRVSFSARDSQPGAPTTDVSFV